MREVHRGAREGDAGPGVRFRREDEAVARGAGKGRGATDRQHARVRRQGGPGGRTRTRGGRCRRRGGRRGRGKRRE